MGKNQLMKIRAVSLHAPALYKIAITLAHTRMSTFTIKNLSTRTPNQHHSAIGSVVANPFVSR
uniref:Uncharacterized protein n=1 Tax=Brassica campestris TaxID=3711 RepID=A0A3P6CUG7_BRACM|nr:unnamed protein product [Brassica rapa]